MAIVGDITQLERVYNTASPVVGQAVNPPSGGWLIDFDKAQRVVKTSSDGLEVLKQSIMLALSTERSTYVIYSSDYGQEFTAYLSDQDSDYVRVMLPTLIKNTLMVDDRIITCSVQNVVRSMNYVTCDVNLNTIFGDVLIENIEIGI